MRYKYIGTIGAFLIATTCLLSGLMYYFSQGMRSLLIKKKRNLIFHYLFDRRNVKRIIKKLFAI